MATAAPAQHVLPRTLPESAAAAYLGLAPATLRNWRSMRRGPPYLCVGRRRLYAVVDLERYLAAGRVDPEGGQ